MRVATSERDARGGREAIGIGEEVGKREGWERRWGRERGEEAACGERNADNPPRTQIMQQLQATSYKQTE